MRDVRATTDTEWMPPLADKGETLLERAVRRELQRLDKAAANGRSLMPPVHTADAVADRKRMQ